MKIMVKLISLFKFSWLRKCKVCRVRGTKCLCKRPSLALEHIFFLEERKNKFGARNFSHVSDTMVTTTSSTVMSANNTVLMRGSSFGDEYAFADYYYNPSGTSSNALTQQQRQSSTSSGGRGSQSSSRGSGGSLGRKKRTSPTTNNSTALVRKNSGKMVASSAARRRFEELPNEYTLYSQRSTASTVSSSLTTGSSRRRPLRLQNGGPGGPVRKEESGCSFKFYGRGGHSNSTGSSISTTFNSSRGLAGSKNDSLVLSSSSSSVAAMRVSTASDRLSVDNNFGSYNPRAVYIDNGYTSSILEHDDDDDDDALQQLNGWLQASPSSTAGSFAAPRNIHCF